MVTRKESLTTQRRYESMKRLSITISAAFLVACTILFCSGCSPDVRTQTKALNETLRFRKVESFVFRYTYGEEHQRADVYEDKKTGVRYLYLWDGMANGGPAITRLWDE